MLKKYPKMNYQEKIELFMCTTIEEKIREIIQEQVDLAHRITAPDFDINDLRQKISNTKTNKEKGAEQVSRLKSLEDQVLKMESFVALIPKANELKQRLDPLHQKLLAKIE